MKRVIAFFLFSMPMILLAQKTHTVAAKESFYSIGRMYNVHPKELATFNNIPFEKGLAVGQVIKIPGAGKAAPMPDVPRPAATEQAVAEPIKPQVKTSAAPAKTTGGAPIYHTVAAKEGLYSISKKYNASIADIKKWNNLSSDGLTIGSSLIVGYGGPAAERPATVVTKPVPETKTAAVQVAEPVEEPVKAAVKEVVVKKGPANFDGGYFKTFYNQQLKEKNSSLQDKGQAGIFKSTSGWDDGKYYCLHNSAPAGSFIKITNPVNNKAVYAKVLDLIPDLKQNTGIIIRISNAAASELGVGEGNFECELNY
ncbi:MAG: LysM peptidoglycan-binding domain-containing protein [Chitinophagaceae bacterium]|nr:MAG: LysM peptidoglycan-binding domain-containing protein [Chitinophagaceae bacterium]